MSQTTCNVHQSHFSGCPSQHPQSAVIAVAFRSIARGEISRYYTRAPICNPHPPRILADPGGFPPGAAMFRRVRHVMRAECYVALVDYAGRGTILAQRWAPRDYQPHQLRDRYVRAARIRFMGFLPGQTQNPELERCRYPLHNEGHGIRLRPRFDRRPKPCPAACRVEEGWM